MSDRIGWVCDLCKQPVGGTDGVLYVDIGEVQAAEEQRIVWETDNPPGTAHSLADILAFPKPARWRTQHAACTEAEHDGFWDGSGTYWIGLERAVTHGHLLNWTGHLMGKGWLKDTNWSELLNSVAPPTP